MKNIPKAFSFAELREDPTSFENFFAKNGFAVIDFINPQIIYEVRKDLLAHLRDLTKNSDVTLEKYHELILTDEEHTDLQYKLTQFYREKKFSRRLFEDNQILFETYLGRDLNIQADPYLRLTRPQKHQDNIGYHRDTFYGGSPFELSALITFVDLTEGNSLKLLPGSHLRPESDFPFDHVTNPDATIVKGSKKHQLGFLYAPKVLKGIKEDEMLAVPIKVGQFLTFSLATLHGSVVNNSNVSRWSTDTRICNAFAPVDLSARPTYYESLCRSVVTRASMAYFEAQKTK